MASADALRREPDAAARAEARHGLGGIVRAGGLVAALAAEPRRQRQLVETNQAEQRGPYDIAGGQRPRLHRAPCGVSSITIPCAASRSRMRSASLKLRCRFKASRCLTRLSISASSPLAAEPEPNHAEGS